MYKNNKILQIKTSKGVFVSPDIRTYFKSFRIKSTWWYNWNRHIYKWNGLGNPEAGLTMWKFNEWQLFCSIKWKKDG